MKPATNQAGFSLLELLVSLSLLLVCVTAAASMTVDGSRRTKARQMEMMIQADARNSLALIETTLRSAGWDPVNSGLQGVVVDSTPSGPDNFIEVLADLNEDGDTGEAGEHVTFRHHDGRIEWKRTTDVSEPYVPVSENITNDANEDGTIEPMFVPDSTTNPTRITVTITAQSPARDPATGRFIRCTLTSDVVLRDQL